MGSGNDEIDLGFDIENYWDTDSDNTVDMGTGDDTVNLRNIISYGDGIVTLDLGAGNDELNARGNIDDATVNAGAGDDTLKVGGNIIDNSVVNMGDGIDTVNITGNISNPATLNLGSGNDTIKVDGTITGTINGDAGDDTFNIHNQMTGNINGGTGKDTLNIFGTNNTNDISLSDVVNVEVINLNGSGRELDDVNSSNLIALGNDLYIQGEAGDYVDIGLNNGQNSTNSNRFSDSNSSNWSTTDTIADATDSSITYNIWTNDTTNQSVYIQDTINVI